MLIDKVNISIYSIKVRRVAVLTENAVGGHVGVKSPAEFSVGVFSLDFPN